MKRQILKRLQKFMAGSSVVQFKPRWALFFAWKGVECTVHERPASRTAEASHQGSLALLRDALMEQLLRSGHVLVLKSGPLPELEVWLNVAEQLSAADPARPHTIVADAGALHLT